MIFFINNFNLYRNIYKILINLYLNYIFLRFRDKFKRYNIISIILKSYKSKFEDVLFTLKDLKILNRGINLNINEKINFIYLYILIVIKDIL